MLTLWSSAQLPVVPASNLRVKTVSVADTLRLDARSIIPNTLSVDGIPSLDYAVDEVSALLWWIRKPQVDSVTVRFRVFPFRLNPATQRMSYDSVMNNFYVKPFDINAGADNRARGIFDFGGLKAEGSFGRQVGFGNSQDAVVNSTLNMQLSGMLGDSIELQAAITDNNIPIQPDGTTQQLNEFDQVYLQFRKKRWQLNLGDIDIRQTDSYFLNFYKRLQGISFQTSGAVSPGLYSKTLVSGSIAKGKFTRNIIPALEGNQGPYRLRGANNEFFFIVLANTERIFLDGELLQRGEDQDYVINYNSAEVTFTPRRMITKDSRIQVEFEYADRNYLNANIFGWQEFEVDKKLKLRVGIFNNNDAKHSQINQELDAKQVRFLAELGDSVHKAFYPSATLDTFAAGKILYEKVYDPTPGVDSFYRYSTDPALAKYQLSFVDVGQGNGNYVPDFNGANGKVYRFVYPIAGVKQGQFEPAQVLITPKKQQLVSVSADYSLKPGTGLRAEWATSKNDVNTFSTKHNSDDRGWAGKIQLNHSAMLNAQKKLQWHASLDYEHVNQRFRPLERLRAVEFGREWGLPLILPATTENIVRAGTGLRFGDRNSVTYQFMNYSRSDRYRGIQNQLAQFLEWKNWSVTSQLVLTSFSSSSNRGIFLRPVVDISRQLGSPRNWRVGFKYAAEKNTTRFQPTDTLTPLSFSYDSYVLYLRSDESRKDRYGLSFFTRTDKYPVQKQLVRGETSYNLNLQTELLANSRRQFYLNATFRKLQISNESVSRQKADETILGRAEYVMNEWKGLLTGNLLYEVGAGQEQRRDFAYLEVPPATGQYAWIDYNNDGVQQLNEFELAAFPDQARFIRILTPTNEFIKANYITFNYSLNIQPRSVLNRSDLKGFRSFVARLNLATSLQINKKSIAQGSFEFNPFRYDVTDTALVVVGNTFLNTLSFNRYHSKWGIDFSNLRNNGKSLLTYGYESRKLNDWLMKLRWNVSSAVLLMLNGKLGSNALFTPQFGNRNYYLRIYNVEPQMTWIRGTSFRVVGSYRLDARTNRPEYGGEKSFSHSLQVESKYNLLQNSSLTGRFIFNNIDFHFPTNTTVSYIMLEGLLPGQNFLWNLSFTKRLLNNLELSFQYDGRKSGQVRTVHLGRAAITALF